MNELRTAVSELLSELLTIRCLLSTRSFTQPAAIAQRLRQLAEQLRKLHREIGDALR